MTLNSMVKAHNQIRGKERERICSPYLRFHENKNRNLKHVLYRMESCQKLLIKVNVANLKLREFLPGGIVETSIHHSLGREGPIGLVHYSVVVNLL